MKGSPPIRKLPLLPVPHDKLLFIAAYPSNTEEYEMALAALKEFSLNSKRSAAAKQNAGLRGSVITGSFSFAIAKWLVQTFPGDVEAESSSAPSETVRLLFREILPRTEYECSSTGENGLLKRIQLLKGKSSGSSLAWLIHHLDGSRANDREKESLFHNLQLYIRWKIRHPVYNRSMLRSGRPGIFLHANLQRQADVKRISARKIPVPAQLTPAEKIHLIHTARCTLAFLYRETEPFTYADTNELAFFELERGLSVALFGMNRERRLSIEAYIGYLCFKNGVPVAYGGGWIFGRRCQFGINILPAFRGGESSFILAQLLRVYRQYFAVERFVVKPYQFGKNNREALLSGAFWFYYKAGFRPENEKLSRLAKQEWEKKMARPQYRAPVNRMKAFTDSPVYLDLSKKPAPLFDASAISLCVTNWINRHFNGKRDKAMAHARKKTKLELQLPSFRGWNGHEIKAFSEWSLLLQSTLDLREWTDKQKKGLLQLIRTKGSLPERQFIQLLQQQDRLWMDWKNLFGVKPHQTLPVRTNKRY